MSKADILPSRKIFNDNSETFKNCPETDLIKKTRLDVFRMYKKDISLDILCKRLVKIEFLLKYSFSIYVALLVGIATFAITSSIGILITTMSAINSKQNSGDWQVTLFIVGILFIVLVILGLLIAIGTCHGLKSIEKTFESDTYSLFILPYERHIIINKLKEEHSFTYENFDTPSKRYKRVKRKI